MKILFRILLLGLFISFQVNIDAAKPKKEMALQLYSIREVIGSAEKYDKNHKEVFRKLYSWGYTAVEAANYDQARLPD